MTNFKGVFLKLLATVLVVTAFLPSSWAQNTRQVKGTIYDETGEPFPGVVVLNRKLKLVATTDADGKFLLERVPVNAVLTVEMMSRTTWASVLGDLKPSDLFELTATQTDADGNILAFKVTFKTQTDEDSDEYKALRDANELTLKYRSRAEGAGVLADLELGEKLSYENTLSFPGREKTCDLKICTELRLRSLSGGIHGL